jgi:endoglucanase
LVIGTVSPPGYNFGCMKAPKHSLFVLALLTFSFCAIRVRAEVARQVVVWDGEQANKGAGWANPKTSTIGPQTVEAHSGHTALEFKFKGGSDKDWPGAGWNWCAFQTGAYGTDITPFKYFTIWMKTKGKVAKPQINLLCNGKAFDMPEHHTEKVSVLHYCPQLLDGEWHKASIPLADFTEPKGFDPLHVGELQMFNTGAGDGSFFIDDIGFEDPAGDQRPAAATPAPASAGPGITLNRPVGSYSSPVAAHGDLQVVGIHVCDASGKPYQLKGMSLYWSHWSGQFYTKATINALAEDWRCSVVRAETGAEPGEGGYLDNPGAALAKVKTVVDAAIAEGIYVIIDWHKEHRVEAPTNVTEAVAFFTQMATTYGAYPNVIFEIYNEPNGPQWPAVKAYAETVIGAIRKTGSTNLIVVGTPSWSQDVDIAAADPITDFKNIAYTLHFYAGSHRQFLRDKAIKAMSKGIALFVTEWGTCDSSGNGGLDYAESDIWLNFLNQNVISWLNFSLHDKAETASALKPGTLVAGPPSASDLTPSGVFVYNHLVAP